MISLESEQALLGIALFDSSVMPVIEHLKPEHFAEPLHARIWDICLETSRSGRKIDVRIMKPMLGDSLLSFGEDYLGDLADKAPLSCMAGQYASSIINAWQVREYVSITAGIEHATDADKLGAFLRASIDRIDLASGTEDDFIDAQAAAEKALAQVSDSVDTGKGLGLLCGLKCVDDRLGGFQRGHLVVVGGRPSMGKTALADNMSYGVARLNPQETHVFFNLEMDASELSQRQLSAYAYRHGDHVQYRELKRPSRAHINLLDRYKAVLPKNLLICDQKRISVDDVRRIIWKLKAKRKVGVVFIDYLQLMQMPNGNGKNDAKIIAEATAELKRIAGEAQVCIVLLSQLNRGLEQRDIKRPMMSDLRDSGGIEQDANAILFPYREYYYLKNEPPKDAAKTAAWQQALDRLRTVMIVICAKNRAGETGDDELYCSLGYDVVMDGPLYEVERLAAE